MLRYLLAIPLAFLRALTETLEWALLSVSPRFSDDHVDLKIKRPLWKTILLFPFLVPLWIFKVLLAIVVFPFAAIRFQGDRRRRFLLGLPALFGFVLTVAVIIYTFSSQETVTARYVTMMDAAMKKGDYKLASTLGGRLMAESTEDKPEVAFRYAMALARTENEAKASAIINSLAPDKIVGYPPAHQLRAMQLARSSESEATDETLEAFRWHLSNSSENEQILMLWGSYYQRVGQLGEAIKKIEKASKLNPAHLLPLSELYKKIGSDSESNRVLLLAREAFKRNVDANPLELEARLQLALTLAKLSEMDEAEQVLQNGLLISKSPEILRAAADFYLLKYDLGVKQKNGLTDSFVFLERAMRLDPSYIAIYDRLVQLYSLQKTSPESGNIVKLLEELIVEGKHAAAAHFALSSVLLIDGKSDKAMIHLKQAFQLSPNMPVVCNNLAWMLANSNPPKLDEAYELAHQAVDQVPKSASFRDTLGTILLMQGKHSEAIKELEIALSENADDKTLHAKLARAYHALGNLEIARMHYEKTK